MPVDTATVRRVAGLARIALSDAEADALVPDLNAIIGFVEQLAQVDTAGIEPLPSVMPVPLRLRKDQVTEGGDARLVLANAPQAEHGFFAVPKVIE